MNMRLLVWNALGIAMAIGVLMMAAQAGRSAMDQMRLRKTELDSLEHLRTMVRSNPAIVEDSMTGEMDAVEIFKDTTRSRGIEFHGIETVGSSDKEWTIKVLATSNFPELATWLGLMEMAAVPCQIVEWSIRAKDARGGRVDSRIEFGCRGR